MFEFLIFNFFLVGFCIIFIFVSIFEHIKGLKKIDNSDDYRDFCYRHDIIFEILGILIPAFSLFILSFIKFLN